jgi:hypothetical protein
MCISTHVQFLIFHILTYEHLPEVSITLLSVQISFPNRLLITVWTLIKPTNQNIITNTLQKILNKKYVSFQQKKIIIDIYIQHSSCIPKSVAWFILLLTIIDSPVT